MPSLIPNFEYDIFISYRHKDNKGEQWVTEFVKAPKTELESTFKEDISIYFDSNPHDGLLETHNVDKSLEGKLKCLIFIPIISQTYCDSKSFAWQHEFCAFNRMASEDQFGRDIKLSSGNLVSYQHNNNHLLMDASYGQQKLLTVIAQMQQERRNSKRVS